MNDLQCLVGTHNLTPGRLMVRCDARDQAIKMAAMAGAAEALNDMSAWHSTKTGADHNGMHWSCTSDTPDTGVVSSEALTGDCAFRSDGHRQHCASPAREGH